MSIIKRFVCIYKIRIRFHCMYTLTLTITLYMYRRFLYCLCIMMNHMHEYQHVCIDTSNVTLQVCHLHQCCGRLHACGGPDGPDLLPDPQLPDCPPGSQPHPWHRHTRTPATRSGHRYDALHCFIFISLFAICSLLCESCFGLQTFLGSSRVCI